MAKSVEKLVRESRQALLHAELVEIARENSPTGAGKIAARRGFPPRQCKSVVSLAQLRRDHLEAFTGLITPEGHARSEESDTEHALRRRRMTGRLRQRIGGVKDPQERLRLLFGKMGEHPELKQDAETYLEELLGDSAFPALWCVDRDSDRRPLLLGVVPEEEGELSPRMCLAFYPKDFNREGQMHPSDIIAMVSMRGLQATMGWNGDRMEAIARRVLERCLEVVLPGGRKIWLVGTMITVCRHYLDPEDDLARAVERDILIHHFRDARMGELRTRHLPEHMEPAGGRGAHQTITDLQRELDPIVDRFKALGMTDEEIRKEFLRWLTERAKTTAIGEYIIMVAGNRKVFRWDDSARAQLLYQHYFEQAVDSMMEAPAGSPMRWAMFEEMGSMDMWRMRGFSRQKVCDKFVQALTEQLAKGRASFVYWVLYHFAEKMGLKAHLEIKTRGTYQLEHTIAEAVMKQLAVKAYVMAKESGDLGIAAALSQRWDVVDHDALTEESVREFIPRIAEIVAKDPEAYAKDPDLTELLDYLSEGLEGLTDGEDEDKSKDRREHEALLEMGRERQEVYDDLVREAKCEIRETVETALDLEQPIVLRFDEHIIPDDSAKAAGRRH